MSEPTSTAGPARLGYAATGPVLPSKPPPLPPPGTGGREELPDTAGHGARPEVADGHRPGSCARMRGPGTLAASAHPIALYAFMMVMLIGVWAVSGGGHFWPLWAMIGWGWCLVPQVTDALSRSPRRATDGG
ncbi:2TM domain-containing protein [Ornithinimicrobium sp. LYQ92]|uniref:2TM domain-containing protein n=1 Tax=Serinicoccus sp. LYQ92 TaxID=3378798 RepID=UPI0038532B76